MATTTKKPDPIWIDCEGSDTLGHPIDTSMGPLNVCSMCGEATLGENESIPHHQRRDLLAMIARGDFDV